MAAAEGRQRNILLAEGHSVQLADGNWLSKEGPGAHVVRDEEGFWKGFIRFQNSFERVKFLCDNSYFA